MSRVVDVGRTSWPQSHIDIALSMAREGYHFGEIAQQLGRNKPGVRAYFRRHGYKIDRVKIAIRYNEKKGYKEYRARAVERVDVPPELLADRDRRYEEQSRMTPGALQLGDPEPSRSALLLGRNGGTPERPSAPAVSSPLSGQTYSSAK